MKLKGQKSKLKIYIPDDIDRAIGENARHLVNECGRVVRTKAPLNVNTWKEAFAKAGDSMWREIQNKLEIKVGSSYMKMQAFSIDTMQRLYRLWKSRLHYYYKICGQDDKERLDNPPPDLPKEQWEYCVARFGSDDFKRISERNSKNRLSKNRTTQTTGNLSFAEVEHILTQENNGVKPSADVIWLIEHTTEDEQGNLEWADDRSKEIHEQLKDVVAAHGDSMTQEEILLDVLKPRSGYFRGKGTALPGYSKGRQLLEHQNLIHNQQKTIQEQQQLIKELQQNQERTTKQLEESREATTRLLQQQKEETQRAMDTMKEELLRELAARVTS
ncbi:uncharacterized protein LOC104905114 [Beta vulgaris subsp. vulgaris]|uniref:uncharacterized protein LOC104905114 n=1 Tax=Beta vulgaris subsp. vulgaris TaxID=3555 RepID=UPI002548530F|nr:uncharacterized protein LOC104905114 [Beta vulgaris subsp. vulgaris]